MMYNAYIDKYISMVENDEIVSCKEQKMLMKFLRKKLEDPNIIIDHEIIEKSILVPAKYFHFSLYDWQKFINAFIYGVRYKNGQLVFDRFFILMGRGGGKNGWISYNCFFMLSKGLGIKNYNIDLIATSEDQAKRSFRDVYDVIKDNGLSGKNCPFTATKESIIHNKQRSVLEFNTANAKTKDSKRPGVVIFDEIHQYEDYTNIAVHKGGLGKVKDPREFYISTDGSVRNSVLDDMKFNALCVLNGERPNSTLFPFICKLDSIDEADNPDMWEKANPSLRYNETLRRETMKEYEDIRTNSALRMSFMAKRMNLPVEDTLKAVATWEEIKATNQPFPDDIQQIDAIGGLDYSQIRDFCSVGVLFKKNGKRYWKHHTFMHHTAPKLQDLNMEIINIAIEKKLMTVVYDDSINAEYCIDWFLSQSKTFNFKKICMDNYRASIMKQKFNENGFDVHIVRRGPVTHALLSPLVEEMFVNHSIVFGEDALMRWYCGNIYKDEKNNGNIEYKKFEPHKRKTDGFFAWLHALNLDNELTESFDFDPAMFENFTY